MAEQTPRRAECPACHKSVALRKDGMLWHHTGNEPEWPGSPFKAFCPRRGLPPEPDAPSKRRRRPQPDWADLREMARNAGYRISRTAKRRRNDRHVWLWYALDGDDPVGEFQKTSFATQVHLRGPKGYTALLEFTPAAVLAAARLVGLGGAS